MKKSSRPTRVERGSRVATRTVASPIFVQMRMTVNRPSRPARLDPSMAGVSRRRLPFRPRRKRFEKPKR